MQYVQGGTEIMIKRLIILITDIAIAVSLLLGIWIYYYKAPRYGVHAVPSLEDPAFAMVVV